VRACLFGCNTLVVTPIFLFIYRQTNATTYHLWYIIAMRFEELLEITSHIPLFETGLLLAGNVDPADVQKQLSRWVQAGRIYQLRRGLYMLAPPYQKIQPHPFLVANQLVPASYVSLQAALAYYNLIPEYVPMTTSVTTHRSGFWETPFGAYQFRHIQVPWLTSYRLTDLPNHQQAWVATPEKALLDLVYLTPEGDKDEYLASLRLQNLHKLDLEMMTTLSDQLRSKKLIRAGKNIAGLMREDADYAPL
jgi:hypothetical protein